MEKKKEVQKTISEDSPIREKAGEEEFFGILRNIAPGTHIRAALNGVVKTGKGALIVVGNDWLSSMIDGGFRLNAKFTPQRLIELCKMDGAIILSKDMKRIILANTLLVPSTKTASNETGTRHKAAERIARQAGTLVIAVSERKNEITVYYKNIRYPLTDSSELLRKGNESIQMLEKQRELFDRALTKLNHLELRNYPSLQQAVESIQKGKIIQKISFDLKKYIIELGKEGTLLKTRLKELTADIEKETDLIIKDYTRLDMKKSRALLSEISYEELFDKESVLKALNYEEAIRTEPVKGWRILSKTTIPTEDIAILVKESGSLGRAIYSNVDFHREILGEEKAQIFKNEVENIKLNS